MNLKSIDVTIFEQNLKKRKNWKKMDIAGSRSERRNESVEILSPTFISHCHYFHNALIVKQGDLIASH